MDFGITFNFEKADSSGRFVRGWANVATDAGAPVVDYQGDLIDIEELRKAAHRFILDHRVAKAMHAGSAIGEVVESVIIDDEFAAAVGMTDTKRGWWIGMQIHDEGIRKRVRDQELRAFSIGGKGKRKRIPS